MTPEAPKRSLDAPPEATHREPEYVYDASCPHCRDKTPHHPVEHQEPETEGGKRVWAEIEDSIATGGGLHVSVDDILAIEREAAHPSGAGSGLPFVGEVIFAAHVVTGDDPIPAGWNLIGRASTVSRDGEIAAAIENARRLHIAAGHSPDCSVCTSLSAGLRVAPSAPGDSLDVETLGEAMHIVGVCHDRRAPGATAHGLGWPERVAAEYARLRSEPTGATPESEG